MPDQKKEKYRELHPDPESDPEDAEVISPTTITIDWPAFDLTSSEFGNAATKAFLQYMMEGGPRTFLARIETDREAFMACEYQVKTAKGLSSWDTWDYHGPMMMKVESTFSDKPFKKIPEDIAPALEQCFRAGGYEETSEVMRPFEKFLSPLKLTMSHLLIGFDAKPIMIPTQGGKMATMKGPDFVKSVLEARPEVHIHWRDV